MRKILIISTVSRQFYLFEQGNIEVLKSLGFEVHAAANFNDVNERLDKLDIVRHHFDIERSPFSLKNIKAYHQLITIMRTEKFDAIHCHSPMGGVLARLAANSVGIPTKIYTAHGFHFYKGAPVINWLVYFPIEKLLSKYTDVLITINQEDFGIAKKFSSKKTICVPGIGVDIKKFNTTGNINKFKKYKELGIPLDSKVILSVGELNSNKNQEVIIKSLARLNDPSVVYIICGEGKRERYLKKMANTLGVSNNIRFLGYRNDVNEIYSICSLFVFPSYREGLSVSMMEAMSAGLPIICSSIRGNIDLIKDGEGGYLIEPSDVKAFAKSIKKLLDNPELRKSMGIRNVMEVKKYDKELIKLKMKKLYEENVN